MSLHTPKMLDFDYLQKLISYFIFAKVVRIVLTEDLTSKLLTLEPVNNAR